MKKVLIAADEVDKWSQLCEGLKNEWECTTVNLDVFEKFHTIAVYDAVLMLVRNDNGKLGRLIWEVRQYSRAPIIVVIPGIQAVFPSILTATMANRAQNGKKSHLIEWQIMICIRRRWIIGKEKPSVRFPHSSCYFLRLLSITLQYPVCQQLLR